MKSGLVFRWRKSSASSAGFDCVEVAAVWRKSSFSGSDGECVEVCGLGAIRDSKNPGSVLHADLDGLVSSIKAGRFGY